MIHRPSWRKPFGMLLILAMIAGWAVLAVTFGGLVEGLPELVRALYYLAAGIAWLWVLPLKRLLRWMETGRWRSDPR